MNTHYKNKNNKGLINVVLGLLDKLLHQQDVYQVSIIKMRNNKRGGLNTTTNLLTK